LDQKSPLVGTNYSARMGLWITLRQKSSKVILGKKLLSNSDLGTHQSKDGLRGNNYIIARMT
jgi:hypothetical protein